MKQLKWLKQDGINEEKTVKLPDKPLLPFYPY